MKAVVLAGGEGTRLRPLTAGCAKPMIKLLDKPVLEYIIELLKKSSINDICLTLGYLPETVSSYFGNGEKFGVSICNNIEKKPMGTAGGVAACRNFLGNDDFIVISGDCVCDFDLNEIIYAHREKNADVTIALTRSPEPLEFGSVLTSEDGKITGFEEKPPWELVRTNLINTGIYVISNRVLNDIPANTFYDFSKDLFPKLLNEKRGLFGFEAKGYWCDIGSCESFMQCTWDVLSGKTGIDISCPDNGEIYSHTPLFYDDVTIESPCFIGQDAVLEEGVFIGKNSVIGKGSIIKKGAKILSSIIDAACVGEMCAVDGAILCPEVVLGDGSSAEEGTVIGSGTTVGEESRIARGVKIWPGRSIARGSRVTENVVHGSLRREIEFLSGGVIEGELNLSVMPETALSLGCAMAQMGRINVCFSGGEAAMALLSAFSSGVVSAGGEIINSGEAFPAAAAFLAESLSAVSVFFGQTGGRIKIMVFDKDGYPPARDMQRKIEAAARENKKEISAKTGKVSHISGIGEIFSSAAAKQPYKSEKNIKVLAVGENMPSKMFEKAISVMGGQISQDGEIIFAFDADGFGLEVSDNAGTTISGVRLYAALVLTELEMGRENVFVSYSAPEAVKNMSKGYFANISIGHEIPELRYAPFMAARIYAFLTEKDMSLGDLAKRIPDFSVSSREIDVETDRGGVMEALRHLYAELDGAENGSICLPDGGYARVTPSAVRKAILVVGEGDSAEMAEEICSHLEELVRRADSEQKSGG